MNIAELEVQEVAKTGRESVIHLPSGLLGFEPIKKYLLVSRPEEEPFQWLQVLHDTSLAFVVVSPFAVLPSYAPDIPAEDAQLLRLEEPEDALLLNIITLRPNGRSTINLKGPVVINRHSFVGKQVVLANAAQYSVQHPLPTLE